MLASHLTRTSLLRLLRYTFVRAWGTCDVYKFVLQNRQYDMKTWYENCKAQHRDLRFKHRTRGRLQLGLENSMGKFVLITDEFRSLDRVCRCRRKAY